MIKALMQEFPFLDHLMAETLVHAYENGTLPKEEGEVPPPAPPPAPPPVQESITVSDEPIATK